MAEDGAGNTSEPGPSVTVKTPDSLSPMWPQGAMLATGNLGPHGVTLMWPQAMDDVSVTGYRVYQDDELIATLGPDTTMFEVMGLSPWTDYTFEVAADDQAGNGSVVNLEAVVKTKDDVAPQWSEGSLEVSGLTPYTLTLSWPQATDDVAVTTYEVMVGGELLATVTGEVTSLEVTDLKPWTDYMFQVGRQGCCR